MEDFIPRLGVNIDHVATLRELRGTPYPDLMEAAFACERAGATQITVHLREDRRHIQDSDLKALKEKLQVPLNLEMAATPEMSKIARRVEPAWSCLVPEKRQEVTTEGGLDLNKGKKRIEKVVQELRKKKIKVSLFIEPSLQAVKIAKELGADAVEFHSGRYAMATQVLKQTQATRNRAKKEIERLVKAAQEARKQGIRPHIGHGIDYQNVRALVEQRDEQGRALFEEYNIGHSIVCRAVLIGFENAVREMVSLIEAP